MKGGLPIEAFSAVQELFNGVEWMESSDNAAFWLLKEFSANSLQDKFQKLILSDMKELSKFQAKVGLQMPLMSPLDSDEEKYSMASDSVSSADYEKVQHGGNSSDSENIDRALTTEDSESIGTLIVLLHKSFSLLIFIVAFNNLCNTLSEEHFASVSVLDDAACYLYIFSNTYPIALHFLFSISLLESDS
jgi:hypothetical protein